MWLLAILTSPAALVPLLWKPSLKADEPSRGPPSPSSYLNHIKLKSTFCHPEIRSMQGVPVFIPSITSITSKPG